MQTDDDIVSKSSASQPPKIGILVRKYVEETVAEGDDERDENDPLIE